MRGFEMGKSVFCSELGASERSGLDRLGLTRLLTVGLGGEKTVADCGCIF